MLVDLLTVLTVEQWVEEARNCLQVRPMSASEQLLFIRDHLEGCEKRRLTSTSLNVEILLGKC